MKRRVMYMHTLDGQPASFSWTREDRGGTVVNVPYIHFVGRNPATLVKTLRFLRTQQRWAMQDCARQGGSQAEWALPKRYGYVRVEIPALSGEAQKGKT